MEDHNSDGADVVPDGTVPAAGPGAAEGARVSQGTSPAMSPGLSPGPSPVPGPAAGPAIAPEVSPAWARFTSCRWHHAAEGEIPAHCTNRDVLPLAGLHGFNPESWCPGCPYYKLRRIVRRPQAY